MVHIEHQETDKLQIFEIITWIMEWQVEREIFSWINRNYMSTGVNQEIVAINIWISKWTDICLHTHRYQIDR